MTRRKRRKGEGMVLPLASPLPEDVPPPEQEKRRAGFLAGQPAFIPDPGQRYHGNASGRAWTPRPPLSGTPCPTCGLGHGTEEAALSCCERLKLHRRLHPSERHGGARPAAKCILSPEDRRRVWSLLRSGNTNAEVYRRMGVGSPIDADPRGRAIKRELTDANRKMGNRLRRNRHE